MPTPRDRVWIVALALAETTDGFAPRDVRDALDRTFDEEDVPSRGTINSTLNAMDELGALNRLGREGSPSHYVEG